MSEPFAIHRAAAPEPGAIVVVSFGACDANSRQNAIGAVERDIAAAFPQRIVRRAFTSQMVIDRLRQQGIFVDDVPSALARLKKQGVRDVVLQPTHLLPGYEFEKAQRAARAALPDFAALRLGRPLLDGPRDQEALLQALGPTLPPSDSPDEALVLVGHGTGHPADAAYRQLEETLGRAGRRAFVATLEGQGCLRQTSDKLRACGARRVLLYPLLLVAGEHVAVDIAGDGADSWRNRLRQAGYAVRCYPEGLGQNPQVRRLYQKKVACALAGPTLQPD